MRCRICGEGVSVFCTGDLCFRCYIDALDFAEITSASASDSAIMSQTTNYNPYEALYTRREGRPIKYLGFTCNPIGYLTRGYIVNRGEQTVGEIKMRHELSCNTWKFKCTDVEGRELYLEDGCDEDLDTHIRRALTALLHTSKHELCKEDFEYVRE